MEFMKGFVIGVAIGWLFALYLLFTAVFPTMLFFWLSGGDWWGLAAALTLVVSLQGGFGLMLGKVGRAA